MENPIEQFLIKTKADDDIVKDYVIIRKWLQKEGHTSVSSESISRAPTEIWAKMETIKTKISKLKRTLLRSGLVTDGCDYTVVNNYIMLKMKELNKKYPLSDEI